TISRLLVAPPVLYSWLSRFSSQRKLLSGGIEKLLIRPRSAEIFCINSSRVISPFSIKSFASASVCARLETRSSQAFYLALVLCPSLATVVFLRCDLDRWALSHLQRLQPRR